MSDENKKPRTRKRKKPQHGSDAVRESIARAVRDNSDEIAAGLIGKSKEGNVPAIKCAYEIAGEQKELCLALERQLAPKKSLATEWANEPEWTGDDAEAMAWWASKKASMT